MACNICPRNCKIDRTAAAGFCGCSSVVRIARAALHFDEEPSISGTRGSGTIFFSGCNLKCIFCQNMVLTDGKLGEVFSVPRLAETMLKLEALGAHNINLVTATRSSKRCGLQKTTGSAFPSCTIQTRMKPSIRSKRIGVLWIFICPISSTSIRGCR